MIFKLETPEHQRTAIQSVVEVFRGMEKNTYDNATDEDIRANYCSLSLEALMANINKIAAEIGKSERTVKSITIALQEKTILQRVNGKRNGYWSFIED